MLVIGFGGLHTVALKMLDVGSSAPYFSGQMPELIEDLAETLLPHNPAGVVDYLGFAVAGMGALNGFREARRALRKGALYIG